MLISIDSLVISNTRKVLSLLTFFSLTFPSLHTALFFGLGFRRSAFFFGFLLFGCCYCSFFKGYSEPPSLRQVTANCIDGDAKQWRITLTAAGKQ